MPKTGSEPMWCLVMFDLPVVTKKQRKAATKFRKGLLDLGFCMLQYSVYVQYLPLASRLTVIGKEIKFKLPPNGDVQILMVSDKQWSKAIRFSNQVEGNNPDAPDQLTIF